MGLVPVAVLVVCKRLGFIAFLVVDIVPEGVEGGYIGVVISGGGGRAGWGGKGGGGKGEDGDTGLKKDKCLFKGFLLGNRQSHLV